MGKCKKVYILLGCTALAPPSANHPPFISCHVGGILRVSASVGSLQRVDKRCHGLQPTFKFPVLASPRSTSFTASPEAIPPFSPVQQDSTDANQGDDTTPQIMGDDFTPPHTLKRHPIEVFYRCQAHLAQVEAHHCRIITCQFLSTSDRPLSHFQAVHRQESPDGRA